jgi:hypothetical protein
MRTILRWLAWRWVRCSDCGGNPGSVATIYEPWGCWTCRNGGRLPVRRWHWLARYIDSDGDFVR